MYFSVITKKKKNSIVVVKPESSIALNINQRDIIISVVFHFSMVLYLSPLH